MNQQDLFDGDILPPSEQEMPEADVQAKCVAYARRRGAYARKFSSPANRSVPDYIFTLLGVTWYVEFKRFGKEPTEAQLEEHKAIRAAGGTVWVVDMVEYFERRVDELIATGMP